MRRSSHLSIQLSLAVLCVSANLCAQQKVIREGKHEVLYLDGLADTRRWAPAECTIADSKELKANGRPTIHMHIPVDYHGGEKAYPVGWPRMYLNLKQPDEVCWTRFERFEFMVYATMSRPKPPKRIINLQIHCPDKSKAMHKNLEEIRLGKWVTVSIPVCDIENVEEVSRLGINISESDYKDGDELDFYFGAFRLVRSAEFGLAGFRILNEVVYQEQKAVKVELRVTGPEIKVPRALPLTLRGVDGLIRKEFLPVVHGVQTIEMEVDELHLAPGEYTLTAFEEKPELAKSSIFRVVESPWKEK